jgi:ribosomal protein S18 acetylase RimI-like enzyme
MGDSFARYLRSLGDTAEFRFGAEAFRRDGFGPDPAFAGLIAERNGKAVGYLLYHFGYDTERGMRIVHVIDLWVELFMRNAGIGRALMREVARIARERGAADLIWTVYGPNKAAAAFYERIGAEHVRELAIMRIDANAL